MDPESVNGPQPPGETMSQLNVGRDESKQTLVNSFRNVVRYAMRKMKRDMEAFGVTAASFSTKALDESLASPMNAGIFGDREQQRSLAALLAAVRREPVTFHFAWKASDAPTPHTAAVELSFSRRTDLKIRLLRLALPEKVPVSPRVGVIEGCAPLEEAVFDVIRVHEDGRLEPFPTPKC